jgi:hypothetical protein
MTMTELAVLFRKPSVQTEGFCMSWSGALRCSITKGVVDGLGLVGGCVLERWGKSSWRPGIRATTEQPQDPFGLSTAAAR